jgi:hypothetical protein
MDIIARAMAKKNSADLTEKMNKVNTNHIFADSTARDTYFTSNPSELVEGVTISVGSGYQEYNGTSWGDKTAIIKGEKGDQGIQGIQGLKGEQGIQGVQGLKGDKGDTGTTGVNGVGIPTGGTSGQVLSKNSNTDYDTHWIDFPTGGGTGGGGDMYKSTYDTDNDGKVDNAETADSVPWEGVTGKPTFSTVATSGSYTDLINKPTIPTDTNQLAKTDIYTKTEINNKLSPINTFLSVAAASNIYTLDLTTNTNFTIETTDATAKTLAFSNVPVTANLVLSVSIKLKYTNATAITFPASVVWQNATIPTFTTGKQYLILFESYDNGTTWLGCSTGAW